MSKSNWFVSALIASLSIMGVSACSDDSGPKKSCGNGVCDADETADTCPVDCGCGNGVINDGEECDGDNLADQTCQSLGYQAGILACTSRCTFDRSRCQGGAVCGNGLLEGGEECDGTDKGGKACEDLGFDGGELGCDPSCRMETTGCCNNSCDQEGAARCRGEVLETCSVAATGCLAWLQTEDCAQRQGTCTEGDDGPYCKYPCRDRCTEQGAHLCDGDVLKVCDKPHPDDPESCLDWIVEQDCAANGQYCGDHGDGAACITPLPGDTCVQPNVITEFPFELSGADFTQDFTNRLHLSDQSCTTGNGAETIFQVDLAQDEALDVREDGGLDAVIRVTETCSATSICLLSEDTPEHQRFIPPHQGTYFVIIEAYSSTPYSKGYDIKISKGLVETTEQTCTDGFDNDGDDDTDCADSDCAGHAPCEAVEATCDDGFDNDGDGQADCADPDCFGQTGCTTETVCGDGQDNDLDGLTDCADSDCDGHAPCEPVETTCDDGLDNDGDGLIDCNDPDCPGTNCLAAVYQTFSDATPIDLAGYHVTFTPNANNRMGYDWTTDASGTPFPVTPGSGTATQTLTLDDDDSVEYTLTQMNTLTFFGQTYQSFHVFSNGYLSMTSLSGTLDGTLPQFLTEAPKIAGMDRDLDPSSGGTITVDEFTDKVAVTFENVPRYSYPSQTVSFQIVIHDDGVVDLYYGNISIVLTSTTKAFVGITNGLDTEPYPDPVDFVVLPPESGYSDGIDNDLDGLTDCQDSDCNGIDSCELPAEATCNDNFDNDADGLTDCDDSDCFGQTGCTTESACNDGLDNDADGTTDCADSDCKTTSPCETIEQTCDDGIDNDGDGLIDCSDPDCPLTSCLRAVYEEFTDDNPIDLQTWHLTFTPDANLRMGYQWTATADGTPFPNVPGSGDVTQTLTMTDDDSQSYQFSRMTSFTFYDQTYQTVYVISNGFVTFENPTSTLDYTLTEFLAEVPKIAAIDRDFSPQNGGTITVDEFTDRWVLTFENVPRFLHNDETVTFQIVLHDDGTIDIYYGSILLTDNSAFAGITDGNSSSTQFPGVTNFIP